MKKFLVLMLAVIMSISMLVSCNPADPQGPAGGSSAPSSSGSGNNSTPPESSEAETEGHGLPELNFDEAEINIACWESRLPEFEVEQEDGAGDPVVDAVYKRNLYTEQLLGVDLIFTEFHTDSGIEGTTGIKEYAEVVKNGVSDPSVNYDIIASYSRAAAQCFVEGLLQPIDLYDYIDLSKEWWPKNIQDEFSMNGRLYFISGDISTNMLTYMYGVFYNQTLTDERGYGSLVDFVNNNEWTLEKMIELSSVYENRDDVAGKSEGDFFGMTLRYHMADALIYGSDFRLAEKSNEDDEIVKVSDDFYSPLFDGFISDMVDYTKSDNVYNERPVAGGWDEGWNDTAAVIFRDGRALFAINRMKFGFDLQATDITYGILPMPKFDSEQEDFMTCVDNSYTLYGICSDTANGDRAAAVIQALGYYGKKHTTPAIFDVTFKGKFSKDPAFLDMFDEIRDGVGFDIGRLFTIHMNWIADIPTDKAIANGQQWSVIMGPLNRKALDRAFVTFNSTLMMIIENT